MQVPSRLRVQRVDGTIGISRLGSAARAEDQHYGIGPLYTTALNTEEKRSDGEEEEEEYDDADWEEEEEEYDDECEEDDEEEEEVDHAGNGHLAEEDARVRAANEANALEEEQHRTSSQRKRRAPQRYGDSEAPAAASAAPAGVPQQEADRPQPRRYPLRQRSSVSTPQMFDAESDTYPSDEDEQENSSDDEEDLPLADEVDFADAVAVAEGQREAVEGMVSENIEHIIAGLSLQIFGENPTVPEEERYAAIMRQIYHTLHSTPRGVERRMQHERDLVRALELSRRQFEQAQEARMAREREERVQKAEAIEKENIARESKRVRHEPVADDDKPATDCNICLEALAKRRRGLFAPCGHASQHYECAKKNFEETGKCPICREAPTSFVPVYL